MIYGELIMAKNDKDFGLWISTTTVNSHSIKRFLMGFIVKKRGESITERIKYKRATTREDLVEIITNITNSVKTEFRNNVN